MSQHIEGLYTIDEVNLARMLDVDLTKLVQQSCKSGSETVVEDQSTFPLLSLPTEVRIKIFELVVPRKEVLSTRPRNANREDWSDVLYAGILYGEDECIEPRKTGWFNEEAALCRASSQLRAEALPMFYADNAVKLRIGYCWDRSSAVRFFENFVRAKNAELLRRVEIDRLVRSRDYVRTMSIEAPAMAGGKFKVLGGAPDAFEGMEGELEAKAAQAAGGRLGVKEWIEVYDEVASRLQHKWFM